jgi:hypothetical protein
VISGKPPTAVLDTRWRAGEHGPSGISGYALPHDGVELGLGPYQAARSKVAWA